VRCTDSFYRLDSRMVVEQDASAAIDLNIDKAGNERPASKVNVLGLGWREIFRANLSDTATFDDHSAAFDQPDLKAPVTAAVTAPGDWTVIDGADGQKQWAYKGKPLYRFAKDEKPGDMKGDGFKDVWHTAKP